MSRTVLLIDIGAEPQAGITPVSRPPGSWSQAVYTPPAQIPAPNVVTAPVVDGILIEWQSIGVANAIYIVERGPSETGPWLEIARTSALRYTYTGATDQVWYFRVRASVNGSSGLGGIAAGAARLVPGMQQIEDAIKQGELGQQLVTTIAQVDINSETLIRQSLEQYETNEGLRSARAYIARVEETSVTPEQAEALVQETVGAALGPVEATVQETKQAVVNIDGRLTASYTVKAQVAVNGRYYLAGITAGVYADGETVQTEILAMANTFGLLSSASDGTIYSPFIVQDGVVRIAQAMIGVGWINNAMIGNVIESDNYLWDEIAGIYRGWSIKKDGSARFAGDVEVRGMVIASAISGQFQKTATFGWTGSLSASTTGQTDTFSLSPPIRYGDAHRPVMLIELSMTNGPDHSRDGWVDVQRLDGSTWTTIRSKRFLLTSSSDVTYVMQVADTYTSGTRQYRLQVRIGTSSWGSWTLTEVNALVFGLR